MTRTAEKAYRTHARNGGLLLGTIISPSYVAVAADLADNRNERVVPIVTPDVTGAPAPGFRLDTVVATPIQVTLTGDPQLICTVANIPTHNISIDGLNDSKTFDVQIDISELPPGTSIKGNVMSVRVQINIVPITQDIQFTARIQQVNVRPGLTASLSQQDVLVTLRGTSQELSPINGTNLIALANLASFTGPSGPKPVDIDGQLPSGSPVKVINIDPRSIQVTVTAIPTPTPVPTATALPPTATPTPRPPTSTAPP
ncbi:MAG: CdaR family protein [Chloroflexota bacterium]|nr:CdaR family protein [Chloroflexota bacterium]